MARGEDQRDVPAQQGNPTTEEEMIRSGGDADDMIDETDDAFEETEDLDDEQEDGEGTF